MIFIDRNASRDIQMMQQTKRCYDDYCFYNRFEVDKREKFLKLAIEAITEKNFIVPYLPLYLTTACSLNCVKCNNLMPMFHGKAFDFRGLKPRRH